MIYMFRDAELDLTPEQWISYREAEEHGVVRLTEMGDELTIQHVFELVLRLKQICNFDPAEGSSSKLERLRADLEAMCRPFSHAELALAQHAELTAASHESKDACSLHLSGTPAWSIRCSVPLPEIGTAAAPPSRRTSARAGSMVKRRQTEQLRCAAAESRLPLWTQAEDLR